MKKKKKKSEKNAKQTQQEIAVCAKHFELLNSPRLLNLLRFLSELQRHALCTAKATQGNTTSHRASHLFQAVVAMRTARARVHATLVNWKAQYRGKRKLSQEESPGKEEPRKKRKEASKQKKKRNTQGKTDKGTDFPIGELCSWHNSPGGAASEAAAQRENWGRVLASCNSLKNSNNSDVTTPIK